MISITLEYYVSNHMRSLCPLCEKRLKHDYDYQYLGTMSFMLYILSSLMGTSLVTNFMVVFFYLVIDDPISRRPSTPTPQELSVTEDLTTSNNKGLSSAKVLVYKTDCLAFDFSFL